MQQTENYKFNLIEPDDPFSPTPLNENAEALDAQLARMDAALGSGGANCRVFTGSYTGTGTYNVENPCRIEFPFKPLMVVVFEPGSTSYIYGFVWPRGAKRCISIWYNDKHYQVYLSWTDNSVSWYNTSNPEHQMNARGIVYHYIAIGV